MKKIIIAFLLFTSVAGAQNGGTVESRYGIGELDLMVTARQRGMGTTASGLASSTDINSINPAAWSSIMELRLQGGMSFEYITTSHSSDAFSSGAIKGFSFVFPLEESMRLRLGSAMMPVSRSEYKTLGYGTLEGEPYTVTYEGAGGLSLFRAGLSAEPLPHVKIGAAYNYYFGNIDQSSELRFDNGAWFPARQTRATSHSGSGFLLGALYDGVKDLTLGVSMRTAASLNASRNLVYEYSTQDSTLLGASGTQDLPMALSVGVSWQVSDELLLATDYSRQDWTDAIVFDGKQNGQGEAYKWAVGAEWYPYKNDLDARTLSRTAFRVGFYQQQTYMSIDNQTGTEYFFTAGAGFPIFGSNRGDVALEYGWRGSDSQLLGTQNILRATVSVTVGEPWFIRKTD
ncbi:MAG: hypothetical protein IH600_02080 [Bacteroidetes bacterium]|nr:hypothetical protein [Bacteroidota bacterium]